MALTLYENELLATVLDKFKVQFPMLSAFTTDFGNGGVVLNQTKTARVRKAATVRDYDGTTGYAANAAATSALLEDVPVTMNRHKHVPVVIDHIDQAGSTLNLMEEAAAEIAFDLGKEAVDYVLGLCKGSNFSQSSEYTQANSDLDATENIRGDLNAIGARQTGRFGIVNTGAALSLGTDARVASRDYHGILNGANAFRGFANVSGFDNIWEYPSLPDNNVADVTITVANATDIWTTGAAHGLEVGDRIQLSNSGGALPAGSAASTDYYVKTVPSTTTLTLSASDGGAILDVSGDGTGTHTLHGWENLSGFFGTKESIILVADIPRSLSNPDPALANVVDIETMTDPDTGLTIAMLTWASVGLMDVYKTCTWIYGAKAGRQAGAAGVMTDYAGHRLVDL
jgi:hypothetical protein